MKAHAIFPTQIGRICVVTCTVIAILASGLFAWSALGFGIVGGICLLSSLRFNSVNGVTIGACSLVVAAMFAGYEGAPALAVLITSTIAIITWDIGRFSIRLERQLGVAATTVRLEAVHILGTLSIGFLTTAFAYGIFISVAGGITSTVLALFVIAAMFLILALR